MGEAIDVHRLAFDNALLVGNPSVRRVNSMATGVRIPLPSALRREPIDTNALYEAAEQGDIQPASVAGLIDQLANEQTRWAVAFGHVNKAQADVYKQSLLKRLDKHRAPLEAKAYRRALGVMAPVEPLDWAITGTAAAGVPYIVSRLKGKPIKPVEAVGTAFGPSALPYTSLGEMISFLGINPLRDPLYQRGERGYWKSVGEGVTGQVEDVGRKSEALRKRYGLLGLPLQALHGILNPVSSVMYAGRSLKDLLTGPDGTSQAKRAEAVVSTALREN